MVHDSHQPCTEPGQGVLTRSVKKDQLHVRGLDDELLHLFVDLIILSLRVGVETESVVGFPDDVIKHSVSDIDFLVDTLKVSDVIEQAVVEHLQY